MTNPLRIILSIVGTCIISFALFNGYNAAIAKDYSGLIILFLILSIGFDILLLGIRGKKSLWSLGKKLISFGIGFIILAVFIYYAADGTANVKDDMSNAMADAVAEASIKQINHQINTDDIPKDMNEMNRECSVERGPADPESFTMTDICDEFRMPESSSLNAQEIVTNAIERKTREMAVKQVKIEIDKNENFDKSLDDFAKSKGDIKLFFAAGLLMFIAGAALGYFGREENDSINKVIYKVSFASLISCATTAAVFKLVDYFIKSQLISGNLFNNPIMQKILPKVEGSGEIMQEASVNMIKGVGKAMYKWLGTALNNVFILSIILCCTFLTLTVIFYIICKKARNPSSDKRQAP